MSDIWYMLTGLQVNSKTRKIIAELVYLILLQPGEDPIYPGLGAAPPLFTNPSTEDFNIDYYRYQINQQIERYLLSWVDRYRTEITFLDNRLSVTVEFTTKDSPIRNILTLGYYVLVDQLESFDLTFNGSQVDILPALNWKLQRGILT